MPSALEVTDGVECLAVAAVAGSNASGSGGGECRWGSFGAKSQVLLGADAQHGRNSCVVRERGEDNGGGEYFFCPRVCSYVARFSTLPSVLSSVDATLLPFSLFCVL